MELRTVSKNKTKYKTYANKLTSIKRFSEKLYYSNGLVQHKNNIKETWKVLNEAIKKKNITNWNPDYLIGSEGNMVKNSKSISNGFN